MHNLGELTYNPVSPALPYASQANESVYCRAMAMRIASSGETR